MICQETLSKVLFGVRADVGADAWVGVEVVVGLGIFEFLSGDIFS